MVLSNYFLFFIKYYVERESYEDLLGFWVICDLCVYKVYVFLEVY